MGHEWRLGPGTAPPRESPVGERLEERLWEGFYGSGSEEAHEERVREERKAHRIAKPIERDGVLRLSQIEPENVFSAVSFSPCAVRATFRRD
jgi:hypothetical protein